MQSSSYAVRSCLRWSDVEGNLDGVKHCPQTSENENRRASWALCTQAGLITAL